MKGAPKGTASPGSRMDGASPRFVQLGGPEDPASVWRPRQVHGSAVVVLEDPNTPVPEADAVITMRAGLAVGVATADCVPILVSATNGRGGRAVGAIHAGWRGLAAGIVERALLRLREAGGDRIEALLGPAAGGCCYEVGPEVIDGVSPREMRLAPSPAGRRLLDLRGVAADRLRAAGVEPARIATVGGCTICSTSWPSYRREGSSAGRILAFTKLRNGCPPGTASP